MQIAGTDNFALAVRQESLYPIQEASLIGVGVGVDKGAEKAQERATNKKSVPDSTSTRISVLHSSIKFGVVVRLALSISGA